MFTFTLGLVSFVAVSLYGSGTYLNIGPGAMERIFFAADLTWLIVIGLRLITLARIKA